jgi:hypothetical protein
VACASGGSREESATPCPLYLYVQEQRIITAASIPGPWARAGPLAEVLLIQHILGACRV